jgi:hypothetical protein
VKGATLNGQVRMYAERGLTASCGSGLRPFGQETHTLTWRFGSSVVSVLLVRTAQSSVGVVRSSHPVMRPGRSADPARHQSRGRGREPRPARARLPASVADGWSTRG